MKKLYLLIIPVLLVLASCSKKTIPAKGSLPRSAEKGNTTAHVERPPATATPPANETAPAAANTAAAAFSKPMIVIDETGKIITSRDQLPDEIASKVDFKKITRSFTPAQRQNLIYRFKMVPPRVLFVPESMASKTAKGYYCVYKKKFWYWKKEDGLYYLDETYYQ